MKRGRGRGAQSAETPDLETQAFRRRGGSSPKLNETRTTQLKAGQSWFTSPVYSGTLARKSPANRWLPLDGDRALGR